eukprot:5515272-Pyramimonas_sp.AAC.1
MSFKCCRGGFDRASQQECGQVFHAIPSLSLEGHRSALAFLAVYAVQNAPMASQTCDKDRGIVAEGNVLAQRSGI